MSRSSWEDDVDSYAEADCHELLLRLAGRLPDRQLWRFRDWLASGAVTALARTLPLTLLRERVGLTAEESRLLTSALRPAGADPERLNALPWVDEMAEVDYTFTSESPEWVTMGDSTAVVIGAIVRDRTEIGEVRGTWRLPRTGGDASRVILVTASTQCARLAGELQRVLRALGTHEPSVEVIPRGIMLPRYHQAALAASEPLAMGAADGAQLVPG
jgi:hypothetical protein